MYILYSNDNKTNLQHKTGEQSVRARKKGKLFEISEEECNTLLWVRVRYAFVFITTTLEVLRIWKSRTLSIHGIQLGEEKERREARKVVSWYRIIKLAISWWFNEYIEIIENLSIPIWRITFPYTHTLARSLARSCCYLWESWKEMQKTTKTFVQTNVYVKMMVLECLKKSHGNHNMSW